MNDNVFPFLLVGVAAVIGFAVSLRRPDLPLILIFAALPFPLAIGGEAGAGNLSPADVLAMLALALLLVRRPHLDLGPPIIPLLFFFAVCLTSTMMAADGTQSWLALIRMFLATGVAALVFGSSEFGPPTFHRCMAAYVAACMVLAIISLFTFASGGFQESMYTLGINKNCQGPIFGCGVVVSVAYLLSETLSKKRRTQVIVALGTCVIGQMLSLSRGSWVATGVALLMLLLVTRRIKAFAICVTISVPVVAAIWSLLPEEAINYATDVSSDTYVIRSRLDSIDVALDAYRRSPIFGVGVGLRRIVEPHNTIALTLGETGTVGLVGFVGIFVAGLYTFWKVARRAKLSPETLTLVLAGAAVFVLTNVHGLMDVYWRRGVGFMGWACVGMAIYVLNHLPTEEPILSVPKKRRQRIVIAGES